LKIAEIIAAAPKRRREEAVWLLGALLGKNRSELFLDSGKELDQALAERWPKLWARRLKGEPLQYIAGSAPFYGREIPVQPGVLIPRPETESLVELCLGLPLPPRAAVLDIGTGSGAVAITLGLERPSWCVTATDISAKALGIAKKNAASLGAEVAFFRKDLFPKEWRKRRFDLVVSNPPYLDLSRDRVTKEVKEWEPRMALEPSTKAKVSDIGDRAAWCGERILASCAGGDVGFTALELSARVALRLEARWRNHPRAERVWRAADLAGRKRFLLVAWKHA